MSDASATDAPATECGAPLADPHQRRETDRRRTFGIISHPDAGKTTLTEQMLVRGGALRQAGDVRGRRTNRYAASDWMDVERERGISVTSSVMQFEVDGRVVNLLDTPGHEDFSEDTFRVLTAVDSALMVIDSVKGVESRTRQLMEVCRLRDTPVVSFINKLDREGRDPLDLLAEIEDTLDLEVVPLAWPVGMGARLKGIYHRPSPARETALFEPFTTDRRSGEPVVLEEGLDDEALDEALREDAAEMLRFDVALQAEAGASFDLDRFLAGKQTPVFFGSALTGLGVTELLRAFVELAPPPRPRETTTRDVHPHEKPFTGLVFKIQANMDPQHRDRMAFVRICSGRFERGLRVVQQREKRDVRVANAMLFQARSREGVEEAFPGDIVGIPNHGTLRIGDSLTEGEPLHFTGIPSFAPEHFRRARTENALRAKQLGKGLDHLTEEGAIQVYRPLTGTDYILGAVGPLQFEVTAARLEEEYNVEVMLDQLPYQLAHWVHGPPEMMERFRKKEATKLATDPDGDLVFLASSAFWMNQAEQDWPELTFRSTKEHV